MNNMNGFYRNITVHPFEMSTSCNNFMNIQETLNKYAKIQELNEKIATMVVEKEELEASMRRIDIYPEYEEISYLYSCLQKELMSKSELRSKSMEYLEMASLLSSNDEDIPFQEIIEQNKKTELEFKSAVKKKEIFLSWLESQFPYMHQQLISSSSIDASGGRGGSGSGLRRTDSDFVSLD